MIIDSENPTRSSGVMTLTKGNALSLASLAATAVLPLPESPRESGIRRCACESVSEMLTFQQEGHKRRPLAGANLVNEAPACSDMHVSPSDATCASRLMRVVRTRLHDGQEVFAPVDEAAAQAVGKVILVHTEGRLNLVDGAFEVFHANLHGDVRRLGAAARRRHLGLRRTLRERPAALGEHRRGALAFLTSRDS